jgi:hypothetical protein
MVTKEEQERKLLKSFGLSSINMLVLLPTRFRDGCKHYYDPEDEKVFSWNFMRNK